MRTSTYNVIYDGHIIFTGTEREVQRWCGMSECTRLSYYITCGSKLCRKYDLEYAERPEPRVVYDFYENGEWVFRGTNKEFKDHFNVQFTGSVASYARSNSLILGRFRAYHANEGQNDKKLDYFAYHLETYGNTVSKKDPAQYMSEYCNEWCAENCGSVEGWECWQKWLELKKGKQNESSISD